MPENHHCSQNQTTHFFRRCWHCGKSLSRLSYKCHKCGKYFCPDCRQPENHGCKVTFPGPAPFNPSKKTPTRRFSGSISDLIGVLIAILIIASFLSNLIFPFILLGIHQNMQLVLGNPKSTYFYDVSSSCNGNENDIVSALDYLSSATGIKFVRIPPPFALIFGGIEFSCGGVSSLGASGESESGSVGISYIIIVHNQVRLLSTSEEVILHETLHSLGFAHSQDPNSIMYPIQHGDSQIDSDIIDFLKTFYVNNPFSYLNILTLNMITGGFIIFLIVAVIATPRKRLPRSRKRL